MDAALPDQDGYCFAAGTLVHTRDGLLTIEQINVGDWVLSQPEETGVPAYKRVVGTNRFDDKPVVRIRCWSDQHQRTQSFIVTGNQPFYVRGHDIADIGGTPEKDARKPRGWRRADLLQYGAVLELANGETLRVTDNDPIWRTRTEGVGFISRRDSEIGQFIDMRGGAIEEPFGSDRTSDFLGVADFNERYENDEYMDKWAYKCAVHHFEVEDFHTYYVGEAGVWVHNRNRFETSAKDFTRELTGIRDITDLIRREGCCFAAGTLVHTNDGQVPIERIKTGDWVLSQPEATGERAYKRVVRITRFDDKAVVRVRCISLSGEPFRAETLIVTGNHPFFVHGYDVADIFGKPEDYADMRTGWVRADRLVYGAVVELTNGERMRISMVDRIWRTRTEGVGFISPRDQESGDIIDMRGGTIKETFGAGITADFFGVEDFNWRYEDEELIDKWACKRAVHNFEVEDFHTYYVGEGGVWVLSIKAD